MYVENTEQRGTGIENDLEWSSGTVNFDQTGPTEKSGPPRKVGRCFQNFSACTESIHSFIEQNFRKFWSNGSLPLCLQNARLTILNIKLIFRRYHFFSLDYGHYVLLVGYATEKQPSHSAILCICTISVI